MKNYSNNRWIYLYTFIIKQIEKNNTDFFKKNYSNTSFDLEKVNNNLQVKKTSLRILDEARNGNQNIFNDLSFLDLIQEQQCEVNNQDSVQVIMDESKFEQVLDFDFLRGMCNDKYKVISSLNRGLKTIDKINPLWKNKMISHLSSVVGVESDFNEIVSGFTHDFPGFINFNINADDFVIGEQLSHEVTHLMLDNRLFFDNSYNKFIKSLPPIFSIFVNKPRTAELVIHGLYSYSSVYLFWKEVSNKHPKKKKIAKERMNDVKIYIEEAVSDLNNILSKSDWVRLFNYYKQICPLADMAIWDKKTIDKEYPNILIKKLNNYLNDLETAEIVLAILGNKVSRISMTLEQLDSFYHLLRILPVNYCFSNYLFESQTDKNISDFKNVITRIHNLDTFYKPSLEIHIYFSKYKSNLRKAFLFDQSDDCAPLFKTPDCCEIFFKENWNDAVEKYQGDLTRIYYENEKNIETNPIYNPVSMYFGKGLCWHFPCSLSCKKTKQMIDQRISLLKKHEPDLLNRLMEIKDYKIIYKNQKYDMVSIK